MAICSLLHDLALLGGLFLPSSLPRLGRGNYHRCANRSLQLDAGAYLARDEEIVDLTAESVRDGSLRVWMHPLPDGEIAVDTDLAVNGLLPLRSSFSSIQHNGTPQRVFSS